MQKENEPSRYKWRSAATPHTGEYLSRVVLNILDGLNAQAVMDFGSGNGALCAPIRFSRGVI